MPAHPAAESGQAQLPDSADPEEGVVSFALLWDIPTEGSGGSGGSGSSAGADDDLPAWTRGVFAIRCGGPEFKWQGAGEGQQHGSTPLPAQQPPPQQQVPGQGPPPGAQQGGGSSSSASAGAAAAPAAAAAALAAAAARSPWAVMWLSGEDALAMERCSDEEVLAATRGILRRFPAALAGMPASWDVSAQAAGGRVVRSRFGNDPFIRGSYSYLGLGAGPEDVAALLEPIPGSGGGAEGGLVLLAGEACNIKYIGCAHAAVLSAEQQAARLLELLAGRRAAAA